MGLLYGRAGRLTAENGGFRPGQCATWFDGCNQCAVGNSTADSCHFAFDGECDEPWLCDTGTDGSDCALHPAGGWTPGGWMDGGWCAPFCV